MEDRPAKPLGEKFRPNQATLKAWEARGHLLRYRESEANSQQAQEALEAARESFGEVFRLTEPQLSRNILVRSGGDTQAAPDILQETYLQAFDKLHTFRGDSQIGSWLHRIMFNKLADYYRQQAVRKRSEAPDDEPQVFGMHHIDKSSDPEWAVLHKDAQRRLLAELNQLTPGRRTAVMLFHILDFSHDEIARLLGVSREGSKSLVFHGIKKLKESHRARDPDG